MNTFVIPHRFTDKAINDELKKLAQSISFCKSQLLTLPNELSSVTYEIAALRAHENESAERYHRTAPDGWRFVDSEAYEIIKRQYDPLHERKYSIERRISLCASEQVQSETKTRELEALLPLSPVERMEKHYQILLDTKSMASDEKEFSELVEKFREMEGYKNSVALADECKGLAIKTQYDYLVATMKKVSTEAEYLELAKQFKKMGEYENATELTNECVKQCRTVKEEREQQVLEARYQELLAREKKISQEQEYQELAKQFCEMSGYKDTGELARECETRYLALKTQREEQELLAQKTMTRAKWKKGSKKSKKTWLLTS